MQHRLVPLLVLLAWTAAAQTPPRLKVAESRRMLVTADGAPFFYLGDTAWELLHRLNRAESERYLRNRAAKGFTVIQTVVLSELDGLTAPNANGDLPLMERDPARPNEAYFAHVDFVLDTAGNLGLYTGLLPTWGKYWKAGKDRIFTAENARSYGRFLGQRYKNRAVIWILGGDQNVDTAEERAVIDAMAEGLRAGDGGAHLITFHPRGPGQSSLRLQDAKWLDFHMSQSSHGARDHDNGLYAEHDLALRPLRPTLDAEPRYEGIPVGFYLRDHNRIDRFDDADARQAAWWSVLAGACGHTYGNNNVWQMWAPGRNAIIGANVPWTEALDHAGAFQMGHLRKVFAQRRFDLLRPHQEMIRSGPASGGAKVRGARAEDGSYALVYSPRGEAFSVDKGAIPFARVRESWYDPRYGVTYEMHLTDNQGIQTYTPPTSGRGQDWVLILERAP